MTTTYLTIKNTELSVCTPPDGATALTRVLVALGSTPESSLQNISVTLCRGTGLMVTLSNHSLLEVRDMVASLDLPGTPDHFAWPEPDIAIFGFAWGRCHQGGISLTWAHEPMLPSTRWSGRLTAQPPHEKEE